jgi:hypothetical protein
VINKNFLGLGKLFDQQLVAKYFPSKAQLQQPKFDERWYATKVDVSQQLQQCYATFDPLRSCTL